MLAAGSFSSLSESLSERPSKSSSDSTKRVVNEALQYGHRAESLLQRQSLNMQSEWTRCPHSKWKGVSFSPYSLRQIQHVAVVELSESIASHEWLHFYIVPSCAEDVI